MNNDNKIHLSITTLLLLLLLTSCTQSKVSYYEGHIRQRGPIWFEIDTSRKKIEGVYFNKNNGISIPLTGIRKDDSLFLDEYTPDSVVATWKCHFDDEKLDGLRWEKLDDNRCSRVSLLSTNGMFKNCTVWNPTQLPFSDNIGKQGNLSSLFSDPSKSRNVVASLKFSRCGFFQYVITTTHYSCHISSSSTYYFYDMLNKKEIHMQSELDTNKLDSLNNYLHKHVQPEYDDYRNKHESICYCDLGYNPDFPPEGIDTIQHTCPENKDSLWLFRLLGEYEVGRVFGFDMNSKTPDSTDMFKLIYDLYDYDYDKKQYKNRFDSTTLANLVDSIFLFDARRVFDKLLFSFSDDSVRITQNYGYLQPPINHDIDLSYFWWYKSIHLTDFVYFLKEDSPIRRLCEDW